MAYEIDQSWKIERTNKDSYFAISNGSSFAYRFKARDKRMIFQQLDNSLGKSSKNTIRIFSIIVALMIYYSEVKGTVFIDLEYPGNDDIIKNIVLTTLRSKLNYFNKVEVKFCQIGKHSNAHILAYDSFRRGLKVKSINLSDVEKLLPAKN